MRTVTWLRHIYIMMVELSRMYIHNAALNQPDVYLNIKDLNAAMHKGIG